MSDKAKKETAAEPCGGQPANDGVIAPEQEKDYLSECVKYEAKIKELEGNIGRMNGIIANARTQCERLSRLVDRYANANLTLVETIAKISAQKTEK